jgi:hypothetical protein
MTQLKAIETMIELCKTVKKEVIKKEKLSKKCCDIDPKNMTRKRIQKINTDLNWQCMTVSQRIIDVARFFEKSSLNVDTSETEFNPSSFHKYRY